MDYSCSHTALPVCPFVSFVILEPMYQSNTTVYVGKVDIQGGIGYNDLLMELN